MGDKYVVLNGFIKKIKGDWGCREEIDKISRAYQPFILKVSERVFYDYHGSNERQEIIQTSHSFFLQLLWEYDLESPVHFSTYIRKMLYYRVKDYYKKDVDVRLYRGEAADNYTPNQSKNQIGSLDWKKIAKKLPEMYLDVVVATVYLGMSQTELAQVFEIPQPYISRIKCLAIEKIARVNREIEREEKYASIPCQNN